MKRIIEYFVKHVVLVNFTIFAILVLGSVAAFNMTSSFFPEVEPQFITVQAVYPGASPLEMEESIVLKIEDNIEGVNGVKRITSYTEENRSTINAEIYASVDENEVLQEIKNAVDQISTFPTGLEELIVYKEEPTNLAGKMVLRGDVPITTLKDMVEQIEDDLRDYENITNVSNFGYNNPEIEINVSEKELRNYDLTIRDISRAVSEENIRGTGGIIRGPELEYRIRVEQKSDYAKNFKNIPVKNKPDGTIIRLSDIAKVKDTFNEGTQRVFLDGQRGVTITVNTTNNEDILAASSSIKEYIKEFNNRKKNSELILVDDATKNLRDRIDLLQENGLLGAALVLLLLGLFLRIRLAFWVALGIPISFCGMFMLALYYGITINVISLFGMIIVIGILVDDGIVVGENIYQKYEQGLPPIKAAVEGTLQVVPAVTSAIITTVIAFSFFYFIPGQLGQFFSEVAFVVSATLLISLIEVFIFLPAHLAHSKSLHQNNGKGGIQEYTSNLVKKVRDRFYIPFLEFSLRNKTLVGLSSVAILLVTLGAISGTTIRTTFFPEIESNTIRVDIRLRRALNNDITESKGREILAAARRLNKRYRKEFDMDRDMFEHMELQVGYESNQMSLVFYLMPAAEREIRSAQITEDLREEVGPIPRTNQLSYGGGTPFGKPVAISLVSPNFDQLRKAAQELKVRLSEMSELTDVIDNQNSNEPELHLTLKDKARALGFSLQDVISRVRDSFFGNEAQRLQRGKNEIRVWVRYDLANRSGADDLLNMRIANNQGNKYPLKELVNIDYKLGLVSINHRGGEREIRVEADLSDADLSAPDVLEEIETSILSVLTSKYPSLDYSLEGQARETGEVATAAKTVLPILLLLIFALILFTFKSFSQSIVLFLIIPFGIIGAAWGHFIHGLGLGILSVLGIIALVGIIVNDGLVLVTTLNDKLRDGMPYYEALVETGRARFRPVILTTGTTAVGLAPLILEESFQAQFLIPMAVSVAYGLLVATFLLLALLPLLLMAANNLTRLCHWIWEDEWITYRAAEPAVKELKWEEENEE
ncbi:Multidrug efflux pump subunit AcrB [Fodinibius salinus]|uniref:Multidrug efflux pump subunit AcrB n=1 Tax=Fodinibius salinus TaxID=860790 RepID=A0A5D3YFV5_9BACT|nr:efflux RND transporter permease subunit [Fodinibius salinus]TYP92021.1 Multidrug efflux pump subunit AcrB [Fodinibius salinus]